MKVPLAHLGGVAAAETYPSEISQNILQDLHFKLCEMLKLKKDDPLTMSIHKSKFI